MSKVVMIIQHATAFKAFNELKQYLYTKDYNDIDLSYYYLPMRFAYYKMDWIMPYMHNNIINVPDIYNHFNICTDIPQEDLYVCQTTHNIEYLLQITSNFINNKLLDDNLESCSWLHNKTFIQYKKSKLYDTSDFLEVIDDIPKADIYLFSQASFAGEVLQLLLMFSLIKKYNAHVLLGGGENNNPTNPVTILFNQISQYYIGNKLHRCSGDIGPTLINFLNNNEDYLTSYVDIHDYFIKPWKIEFTPYELHEICNNSLYLSTAYGCSGRCPYCVGSNLHSFTSLENLEYYEDIFEYMSENYPNISITFFDTELNKDINRFHKMLEWLIDHNIRNKLNFFINLLRLDNDSLDLMSRVNLGDIRAAFDGIFEYNEHRHIMQNQNEGTWLNILNKLKKIVINQGGNLAFNSVMFVPKSPDLIRYKNEPGLVSNVAMQYVKYASDIALEFNLYDLKLNSDMYFNNDKYNIKIYNYQNKKFKDLYDINSAINNIPIFFTHDFTRRDRTAALHEIFKTWKKYDLFTLNNIISKYANSRINLTGYKSFKNLNEDAYLNGYIMLSGYVWKDLFDMYGPNDDVVKYITANIR